MCREIELRRMGQKQKRIRQKDSPEVPDRGETSEISRPPFGECDTWIDRQTDRWTDGQFS